MAISRRTFLRTCEAAALATVAGCGLVACNHKTSSSSDASFSFTKLAINSMSIEEKVSQLFVVTPEQVFGTDSVTEPFEGMQDILASCPVGGIIFFGNNLEHTEQTKTLLAGVRSAASSAGFISPFLCVDEEGGSVQRIGGKSGFEAPYIDHAMNIGATGDLTVAYDAATSIARTLLDLGFDIDFAPSCDVSSGPASMMHKRSFSTDAQVVASMAVEEIAAFKDEGILCCAKHFPGIGDPEQDSHDTPIYTSKMREELEDQLLPFRAAIKAGVPFVMVGHLAVPALTRSSVPASLSYEVVQVLLREELGFEGIIISDSLGMGAVNEYADSSQIAVAAVEAGCDMVTMPVDFNAAYNGLIDAIAEGRIREERIDLSVARILKTKWEHALRMG